MKTETGWMDRDLRRLIMVLRETWYLALILGTIAAMFGVALQVAKLLIVVL